MAFSRTGITKPATKFKIVVPSDTVDVMPGAVGLWVGGIGNVSVTDVDDVTTVFNTVPVGLLPISPKKILTATTATLMVLLY